MEKSGIVTQAGEYWQPTTKEWAEAVTAQCRASNRVLIAVLTVAFFVLVVGSQDPAERKLPLVGISVEEAVFFPASFALLSLTMVAFTATYLQAYRVLCHAHDKIDLIEDPAARRDRRNLLDCFVIGAWSRVAPVDEVLHSDGLISSARGRFAAYLVLKGVYWLAALGVPLVALAFCLVEIRSTLLVYPGLLLAVLVLYAVLVLGLLEFRWVRERWRRLKRGEG